MAASFTTAEIGKQPRCPLGFCDNSVGKESACNAGDPSSIPGMGRSLEKGRAIHSSILGLPWRLSW